MGPRAPGKKTIGPQKKKIPTHRAAGGTHGIPGGVSVPIGSLARWRTHRIPGQYVNVNVNVNVNEHVHVNVSRNIIQYNVYLPIT